MGLQLQQQTRTFVVCQIGKFIALFLNTSISVDIKNNNKNNEARSGREKRKSPKVRTTHSWFANFSLTDRQLLTNY